jgi:hypothetical protein
MMHLRITDSLPEPLFPAIACVHYRSGYRPIPGKDFKRLFYYNIDSGPHMCSGHERFGRLAMFSTEWVRIKGRYIALM